MTIKEIIDNTKCPFAKLAKVSALIVIPSLDLNTEIAKNKQVIADFFITIHETELDALCFAFTDPTFGSTIENLSTNTNNFFKALQLQFGSFDIEKHMDDYNSVAWPAIENERFFMISFAACYPAESPRYNHGDQATYFLLQPVSSFERHARDGDAITDALRAKIRLLFAANNQPYDGKINCLQNEFAKMVAPLHVGDPIVQWWKS